MPVARVEVYPKLGETYPDAAGVPITSVGAIVDESKYIEDALRDGFLLTWDPLDIYHPEDRTNLTGRAPATAPYVTLGADAILTAERVLTQGPGITITDGGPNGPVTISATGGGGAVSSVFGRIGAVVAAAGDYTSTLVNNVSTVAGATITAALDVLNSAISALTTSVAGKAPINAEYLVSTANAELTAERVLAAGANITLTPAPGTLTIAAASPGAPTTPSYVTLAADAALANERVLTQGTGISITDGGPGGAVTISATGAGGSGDVMGPASATDTAIARFSGTTGKLIQSSGVTIDGSNNVSAVQNLGVNGNITVAGTVDGTDVSAFAAMSLVALAASGAIANERVLTAGTGVTVTDGGAGGAVTVATPNAVQGPGTSTDNVIVRFDGTTGKVVQGSNTSIDDAGALTCTGLTVNGTTSCNSGLSVTGSITVTGTVDGIDVAGANAASYVCLTANSFLPNERVLTGQNGVVIADGGAGANVVVSARVQITSVSAGFMLAAAHESNLIVLTGPSSITITVPTNATVALPIGYRVEIANDSATSSSIITMNYQAGVTLLLINAVLSSQIDYQKMLCLTKIATDRWMVTLGQTV